MMMSRDIAYSQVASLASVLCYNAAGSATESEGVGIARHFLSVGERDIDRMISLALLLLTSRGFLVPTSGGEECFVPIMDLLALSRFAPVHCNCSCTCSYIILHIACFLHHFTKPSHSLIDHVRMDFPHCF